MSTANPRKLSAGKFSFGDNQERITNNFLDDLEALHIAFDKSETQEQKFHEQFTKFEIACAELENALEAFKNDQLSEEELDRKIYDYNKAKITAKAAYMRNSDEFVNRYKTIMAFSNNKNYFNLEPGAKLIQRLKQPLQKYKAPLLALNQKFRDLKAKMEERSEYIYEIMGNEVILEKNPILKERLDLPNCRFKQSDQDEKSVSQKLDEINNYYSDIGIIRNTIRSSLTELSLIEDYKFYAMSPEQQEAHIRLYNNLDRQLSLLNFKCQMISDALEEIYPDLLDEKALRQYNIFSNSTEELKQNLLTYEKRKHILHDQWHGYTIHYKQNQAVAATQEKVKPEQTPIPQIKPETSRKTKTGFSWNSVVSDVLNITNSVKNSFVNLLLPYFPKLDAEVNAANNIIKELKAQKAGLKLDILIEGSQAHLDTLQEQLKQQLELAVPENSSASEQLWKSARSAPKPAAKLETAKPPAAQQTKVWSHKYNTGIEAARAVFAKTHAFAENKFVLKHLPKSQRKYNQRLVEKYQQLEKLDVVIRKLTEQYQQHSTIDQHVETAKQRVGISDAQGVWQRHLITDEPKPSSALGLRQTAAPAA